MQDYEFHIRTKIGEFMPLYLVFDKLHQDYQRLSLHHIRGYPFIIK